MFGAAISHLKSLYKFWDESHSHWDLDCSRPGVHKAH